MNHPGSTVAEPPQDSVTAPLLPSQPPALGRVTMIPREGSQPEPVTPCQWIAFILSGVCIFLILLGVALLFTSTVPVDTRDLVTVVVVFILAIVYALPSQNEAVLAVACGAYVVFLTDVVTFEDIQAQDQVKAQAAMIMPHLGMPLALALAAIGSGRGPPQKLHAAAATIGLGSIFILWVAAHWNEISFTFTTSAVPVVFFCLLASLSTRFAFMLMVPFLVAQNIRFTAAFFDGVWHDSLSVPEVRTILISNILMAVADILAICGSARQFHYLQAQERSNEILGQVVDFQL